MIESRAVKEHVLVKRPACAEPAPRAERAMPPSRPVERRALESVVVFLYLVVVTMASSVMGPKAY